MRRPDGPTNEFSICLLPDQETMESFDAIRQLLPPSPYRDDSPHLTWLMSVKTDPETTDSDLLSDIDNLLQLSDMLPVTASVKRPMNGFTPRYRLSSVLLLRPSLEMQASRKDAIQTLRAHDYGIKRTASIIAPAHATFRLGVPFTPEARALADQKFGTGKAIAFSRWVLFRMFYKDGKRLVREVSLSRR